MLNKVAKLLLVSTSFAPVFLTLWFADFSKSWDIRQGILFLVVAVVLVILCLLILALTKRKLEKLPVNIQSISTSDKETVGFILVYLLPLINQSAFQIEPKLLYFVLVLFFISVFTTNSYHFNPILGILGFHFYEVTIDGGITYVLITKKNLTNTKNIKTVVQIAEYMILEIEERTK